MNPVNVTVVIPTIPGRGRLLERAIRSVRAQTHPCALVSVVDENREGAHITRNRALEQVDSEWIAWLDDDDELLPHHVTRCLHTALEAGADLVYPSMIPIGGRDPLACPVNNVLVNPMGVTFGPEQEHHLRTVGNFIPITYLVRTAKVREVGGFPPPVPDPSKGSGRIEEDYGLLLRLLDAGAKFVHVPTRSWRYYFHTANTGGRGT